MAWSIFHVLRRRRCQISSCNWQITRQSPSSRHSGEYTKSLKSSESPHAEGYIWTEEFDSNKHCPLADEEVEIDVEFIGVQASGHSLASLKHIVGRVICQGKDCAELFPLGQRVIVFTNDAAKTRVRQSKTLVVPLLAHLAPAEAIALVEPLIAAQYAIAEVAHLSEGHTLLLDNAASAVGQALIQVAKASGADLFVLVHSRTERDLVMNHFAIPADHIFDCGLDNFTTRIQDATRHAGVDIIVSQQQGPHIAGAMSVLADFGHFIDINGKVSTTHLPPSKSNASITRIDMAHVMHTRPAILGKLFQLAFKKYALYGPSGVMVEPMTNLASLLKEQHTATAILSLAETTPILVPATCAPQLELDANATYILAGGLGALGLNIAEWMGKHGARKLVFFSRSGGANNKAELDHLRNTCILTAEVYICDITDSSSVASVFSTLREEGHTIRGVINLAMVLQDAIFTNMTHAQWVSAISPKTLGSRNLAANLLSDDQPFYILLSSITGAIGNTAQANYASGNTLEDALAHYARTHLGINATSIDVGLVGDSSHFTAKGEFGNLDSYLGRYKHGWKGLTTDLGELGVIMRAAMRPLTSEHFFIPAQVVLGLGDSIEHVEGGYTHDRKFLLRVCSTSADAALGEDGQVKKDVATLLGIATNMAEAEKIVEDDIKALVAKAMGVDIFEVDAGKPLFDYGVDSLQAVEIRNRALKNMRSDISVFDILSAMPLSDVAAKIAGKSSLVKVSINDD